MMILCRFSVAVPSQDHTPAYHRRFTLLHTELPTIAMDPEANGTTTNRQQVFGQVLTAIPIGMYCMVRYGMEPDLSGTPSPPHLPGASFPT